MRRGLPLALTGGAALAAATPPALLPGAEFLVFVGLAVWFRIATASARPLRDTFVLGCVHMVWFSWSVHHALVSFVGTVGMVLAYSGIVAAGALYFVLGTTAVRRLPARIAALGFGVACAGSFWLRANFPEIHYPHGQPSHALWQWPWLLGSVTLGGEALTNVLLGWLAASLVELWQGWRVGVPAWPRARRGAVLALAAAVVATGVGRGLWGAARVTPSTPPTRIALVEPGLHCMDPYVGLSRDEFVAAQRHLVAERLIAPTQELLREGPAPDLVLWPESSLPFLRTAAELESGDELPVPQLPGTVLFGANSERDGQPTPSAWLVDFRSGRVLGFQDKRVLVPGGEFLPVLRYLPAATRDALAAVFGSPAACVPGGYRPPLRTADGVPFGVLICYDNAYPGPAADQVAAGARFFCVLSNESWFRRGSELTQLVAMSVLRALETATPLVRCTTDGWSAVVGADGRVVADLPVRAGDQGPRILRAALEPGPGRLPPMAWLRATMGPFVAFLLSLTLLHAAWTWARLRVARTAPKASGGAGEPVPPGASGS